MPNGQQVPPPQQQASLVTHDIAPGREIGYFTGTGQRGGTTTAGGTFYSISGQSEDILFRTPAEAQQYATAKGTPITSQVGVSDVPSSVYWQQKTAREEAAKSAYAGVRTAAALGEVGKPVAGSQLEAKKAYLERGTGYWASEEQFKQAAESVGKYTSVTAKGELVSKPVDELKTLQNLGFSTEGLRGSYDPASGRLTTVTYPVGTQKIVLPATPRETTEAFVKRMEAGKPAIEEYKPSRIEKMLGFTERPISYPRQTDIFGTPRTRPGTAEIQEPSYKIAKQISTIGLGMGFGEAFTTSSMIRGAKLIQPGDVAAIQRSIKSLSPKMPSGFAEFIRSEEAAVPRKKGVTLTQLLERPKAAEEKPVEVIDISKAVIQPKEPITEVLKIPEVRRTSVLQEMKEQATWRPSYETIAEAKAQKPQVTLMSQAERDVIIARIKASGGLYQKQPTITELKPFSEFKPVSVSTLKPIATTKETYAVKSVALPVSLYKSLAIQEPVAITKQIAKQRAVLTPIEIGMTRQITPQIPKQIQRQYPITPQIPIQRTVTPASTIPTVPTTTTPTFTPPEIPKIEPPSVPTTFEPPRPPRTPEFPGEPRPPREPPIKIPLPFPDFQVYPTRKKGKKKRGGERILKLYPVGAAENILSSLGMSTKKKAKRKHKKK